MENRYKINYDIKLKCVSNIRFKEGDTDSSILDVVLYDGGQIVNLTGETIEFRFLKSDTTIVFQNFSAGVSIIDALKGNVQCILMSNTLASVGQVKCEIYRTKDGKKLTTPSFDFLVEKSIGSNGVLSTNYISAIDNKIIEMNTLYNVINTKLINGELKGDIGLKGDQGTQGLKGDTGAVPNLTVGTVTTLQPGNPVTVIRQVDSPDIAPVFNFSIPKGIDGTGVGDMLKSIYDTTNNGIADNAEKLGNELPAYYAKASDFTAHTLDNAAHATKAAITYYINTLTGLDSNDGLTSGTAFKTIQKTINMLPKIINHLVTINVAAGTYPEDVLITGFNGASYIIVTGASVAADTHIVTSIIAINNTCYMKINGFKLTVGGSSSIMFVRCLSMEITNCKIVTPGSFPGITYNDSTGLIGACEISNRSIGIYSTFFAGIVSSGNTGTANTYGLLADNGGTIIKKTSQPGGTSAEYTEFGGAIK